MHIKLQCRRNGPASDANRQKARGRGQREELSEHNRRHEDAHTSPEATHYAPDRRGVGGADQAKQQQEREESGRGGRSGAPVPEPERF